MIVPQATLSRIRGWLEVLDRHERPSADALGVAVRHVAYARDGAFALGLVEVGSSGLAPSPLGRRLLATRAGSAEEAAVWRSAIAASEVVTRFAPDLFTQPGPAVEHLAVRLRATGLGESTALRRARTLLDWRKTVTTELVPLFVPPERERPTPDRIERTAPTAPMPGLRIGHVRVERYGLLREVATALPRLALLVGPNATGRSTLLDVLSFLSDALEDGIVEAVRRRADGIDALLWQGRGDSFGFALEAPVPDGLRQERGPEIVRYEVELRRDRTRGVAVGWEQLLLRPPGPAPAAIRTTIRPAGWRLIASASPNGSAFYWAESASSWKTVVDIGTDRLALATLPQDPERLPIANRFRDVLRTGVHRLRLEPRALASAASLLLPRSLLPDGSNLARVVSELKRDNPRYSAWLDRVREALPDTRNVDVIADDRHLVLQVEDIAGGRFPAGRVSEGTLRVLALLIVPFVAEPDAIWLVEEPENGVDARALRVIHETFRSVGTAQILVASHSPVLAGLCEPGERLSFSRAGSEAVVLGGEASPGR